MARIKVITNKDGTITVRVGRAVEHIDPRGKDRGEVFDQLKYAAMSKGVKLEDISVIELLWYQR